MQSTPLVSIIIPAYNAESFISQSLDSIINQTYKNWKLLIVDDYSSDNTPKIIKNYQKLYPNKIKAILLKKNIGDCSASNIAFAKTKGEFIARMDADDIALPERLEKQVEFLTQNPKVIVLGSQATVINKDGKEVGKKIFPLTHKQIYKTYGRCNPMVHPSCMFRKSLLPSQKKLYNIGYEPNDDYHTFFELLNYGEFANLPLYLIKYRVHGNNISLKNPKRNIFNAFRIRIKAILFMHYKPTPFAILANLAYFFGSLLLPERLIVPTYLLYRGMAKVNINVPSMALKLRSYLSPSSI